MKPAVHMYVLGALVSLLTIFFGILESIQGSTAETDDDGARSDHVREQMDDIFGRERRRVTGRRAMMGVRGGRRRRSSGGDGGDELLRKGVGRQQLLLGDAMALRRYGH